MVLKFTYGPNGEGKFYGPPYTKRQEAELYRQMATGPHRHASAIRRVQQSPQEPTRQEEKLSQRPGTR